MKLKNTGRANLQFFVRTNPGAVVTEKNQFGNEVTMEAKPEIKLIHIPGGATVIIDDADFEALLGYTTGVKVQREVRNEIEGADVLMGRERLTFLDFIPTGEVVEVSLFRQYIRNNVLIVMKEEASAPELSAEAMVEELAKMGLNVANDMAIGDLRSLYNRLKGI